MPHYGAMKRTTIMLPVDLKARVERKAREDGRSLGEMVRESLASYLKGSSASAADLLLADEAVFEGSAPADFSAEHDRYLYDDSEA